MPPAPTGPPAADLCRRCFVGGRGGRRAVARVVQNRCGSCPKLHPKPWPLCPTATKQPPQQASAALGDPDLSINPLWTRGGYNSDDITKVGVGGGLLSQEAVMTG